MLINRDMIFFSLESLSRNPVRPNEDFLRRSYVDSPYTVLGAFCISVTEFKQDSPEVGLILRTAVPQSGIVSTRLRVL